MILKLTLPRDEDLGLYQLIEETAHCFLPVRRIKAECYIPSHLLARDMGVPVEILNKMVETSDTVHGVELPTDALFIHPDGLKRYLVRWGKRFIEESP